MKNQFSQRVWELAISIPTGRVTTYGAIAKRAGGGTMAARSISSILGKAPNQKAIPWHRIVYAGGKVWLPTDEKEKNTRIKLYRREGVLVGKNNKIINFDDVFDDLVGM